MKTDALAKRFGELLEQLQAVEATKQYKSDSSWSGDYVDDNAYTAWKLKARNLLAKACGETSEHFRTFVDVQKGSWETNYKTMLRLKAVFEAAREDYEGGYCNTVRNLVQAEVFGQELEQACELLSAGYLTAAAVIAGVVLETTLRELCTTLNIPTGALNRMNEDLAKAGRYNSLVQKRITALAGIRNSAAHGHPEDFSENDVRGMLDQVESFVADQL
jgi:hypothetical protein